jgi:hypothetical protein
MAITRPVTRGAEQRERGDDEEHRRDRHHGVGEPHDQSVDPAAAESRQRT